jgi:uncharacterized protein YutE (UPF0331/DUF86 family)
LKPDIQQLVINVLPVDHFESVMTGRNEAFFDSTNAKKHLESSKAISKSDPAGSYQLAYDAARKSIQAILALNGLRVRSAGGHFAFVRIAESGVFESEAWKELREMRRIRNLLEYPQDGSLILDSDAIALAIESAEEMVDEAWSSFQAILEE